jgi:hypothetical protein
VVKAALYTRPAAYTRYGEWRAGSERLPSERKNVEGASPKEGPLGRLAAQRDYFFA